MTNIIPRIRQRLLSPPDFSPPLAIIPRPIQTPRRNQHHLHALTDRTRVELSIDIERELSIAVLVVGCEARHAVVFRGVDIRQGEGVEEELGVAHPGGWWWW